MKFEKSERFKDSKGLKVRRDAKSIKKIAALGPVNELRGHPAIECLSEKPQGTR